MSEVSTPIEQDGYNAYGYVDGKRVPVLSTSMANCWDQDDQRAFCGRIVHCVNNHERLKWLLGQIIQDLPANKDWLNPDIEREARALLAALEAEKGGGE